MSDGIIVKESEFTSQPIPEDSYVAGCFAVYDLGTHFSEMYKKSQHELVIYWELPELRLKFEKDCKTFDIPRVVSCRYTAGLGGSSKPSKLREHLVGWRGRDFTVEEARGFELKNILGKFCVLQIIHKVDAKGQARHKISTITKIMKGMTVPAKTEHELIMCSLADNEFKFPEGTPAWIIEYVAKSEEYAKKFAGTPAAQGAVDEHYGEEPPVGDGSDDEIPF